MELRSASLRVQRSHQRLHSNLFWRRTQPTSYAQYLYTPFIGIVGEKAMDPASGPVQTGPLTKEFYERASEPKEFVEIEGASHVSLYDIEADVTRAVDAMTVFFEKHATK